MRRRARVGADFDEHDDDPRRRYVGGRAQRLGGDLQSAGGPAVDGRQYDDHIVDGLTVGRRQPDRDALGVEGRACFVEQQRLKALPGAQALGSARGRVAADQDGGLGIDVDGVARGVAQHDADAHAFTSAWRHVDRRLSSSSVVGHGLCSIGRRGF